MIVRTSSYSFLEAYSFLLLSLHLSLWGNWMFIFKVGWESSWLRTLYLSSREKSSGAKGDWLLLFQVEESTLHPRTYTKNGGKRTSEAHWARGLSIPTEGLQDHCSPMTTHPSKQCLLLPSVDVERPYYLMSIFSCAGWRMDISFASGLLLSAHGPFTPIPCREQSTLLEITF